MKITTTTTQKKQTIFAYFLLLMLIVLAAKNASAQGEATNWYFGNKAGLNLEYVTYTMDDGVLVSNASCASMCSPNGDLRLYTNGVTVWNAKHIIVENGTGLLGNIGSSQGTIILPVPNSTSRYYIFTAPANGVNLFNQPDSLRYSIVDMDANGGLGKVDEVYKNIPLFGVVEEKLTAVNSPDGGVWLIAHGFKNNKYVAYKLTENGLEGPVQSIIGAVDNLGGRGCIKASPNGLHIARTMSMQNRVELTNFDASTGVVSNSVVFSNLPGCYGVEFSSYSSRLYVTTVGINQNYIQQFNLKLNSPAEMEASKFTLTPPANTYPTALQLAYGGILYIANSQASSLGAISNSDTLGSAIIYSPTGVTLPGDVYSGLPAFNQSYFKRTPIVLSVNSDAVESLEVYPNPSNGIFRLAVGKNKSQDIKVDIYNMAGAKIYSADKFAEGQSVLTVDLTAKPAGIYFFDITTPAGKTVKRMVIN